MIFLVSILQAKRLRFHLFNKAVNDLTIQDESIKEISKQIEHLKENNSGSRKSLGRRQPDQLSPQKALSP